MRKFIIGTDWYDDCDDAVALKILSIGVNTGRAELLGICVNACFDNSLRSIDTFMRYNGVVTDIAVDTEATDFGGKPTYQNRLERMDLSPYKSNAEAEAPVKMYRRLLSRSDEKIDIMEIGFPQVLAKLLDSAPDEFSALSGRELVKEKVGKLWMMAGRWNNDGEKENNFCKNRRSINGGMKLLEDWPTEITFLGWEVGKPVLTGGKLGKDSVLGKVLSDWGCSSRPSWDPMLVLLALTGDEKAAGYSVVRGTARLESDGSNYFRKDENGKHAFVVKDYPDSHYSNIIDVIISDED